MTAPPRLALAALLILPTLSVACDTGERTDEAEGAIRAVAQYDIRTFMGTTSFSGASFSPDNSKVLVSHNGTGVFNAYALPVDGGEPMTLTTSTTDAVLALSYFPEDERFLFTSDEGGNELNHVYVQSPDGSVVDLTPGEGLKAEFVGWSADDTSFFVATNERDARFFDVYEYQVADGYPREMVYRNEEGYLPGPISGDGRYLSLVAVRTTDDSDVYLFDRETDETTHLTPHEGSVSTSPADFFPDGSALLMTTDEGAEFQYLVRHDLATGERTVVDQPDWDVMYAFFSKNGRYLVSGVNRDASTDLRVFETGTMERVELPPVADADITSARFSRDESMMAFYASGSRHPNDLFVQSVEGGEARRLTHGLADAIDPADLVDGEVVRFASYDGLEIPGVLYKPHSASSDSKVPALVSVHGGPGGQSRIGYNALIQYLVNHGYAVYAINNRGSSGYGKTFYAADNRKHGEADLGDVVASKEMLAATGWIDPDRIGIIGGSYGGYMVLAALTLQPDEFDVGVDLFGISNWIRTLESIPPWWEAEREALYAEMGDPATDGERLRRISPLFNAESIRSPLMVLQGANDPRVLQVESDDIVEAAKANGVPVEYLVFDDEGHGFRNKENQIEGYQAILRFLDQYLAAAAEGVVAQ